MSEDKETPPIIFRYEENIAELKKENEQLKIKYSAKCARYDIAQNDIGSLKVEIEQLKREVKKWMDRYGALYSEGYRDILKENRELKRINTLLEENTVKEGYDRIFNKEAAEELSRIEPLSAKGHSLKQTEKPFVEQKAETIHLVKHCRNQEKRIEELENLLNESQTARFGLTLQVTELRKKIETMGEMMSKPMNEFPPVWFSVCCLTLIIAVTLIVAVLN